MQKREKFIDFYINIVILNINKQSDILFHNYTI